MLPAKQAQAYESFIDSTAQNELLDRKTTLMIQMAAAFAVGCYP